MRNASSLLAVLGMVSLSSCAREDDALQSQIIETRAAMEQRNRELEQTQSQLNELKEKMQRMSGASASSDEVARLKARNAELEDQLAAARKQTSTSDAPAKFDMDAIASRLEDDLTRKAKQLRELVQKQTPGGRVDEISLKSIEYPRELLVTFNSAITFNILSEGGQKLRLVFPVTADLGGTWKLPAPAEVQAAYVQAQSQPAGSSSSGAAWAGAGSEIAPNESPTPASTPTPAAPPQVAASAPAPSAPQAPASSGGHSGMRQVDANTFVFSWGDSRGGGAQPQAQAPRPAAQPTAPAPAPVQGNTPIANFTPPGPGGSAPAPAPAAPSRGAAPAAATPPPAAVMPVQQDITIRFD
ncbi:hypothetical protein [Verrucomicrobium spinosum]|uniref:hypothetical protein n=1 Tax=Verrucomicrobium spinosum TaxID=2736 RepID=UPI00017469A0|nr:hypothetical protein [Verrucomicrobium spinosum]